MKRTLILVLGLTAAAAILLLLLRPFGAPAEANLPAAGAASEPGALTADRPAAGPATAAASTAPAEAATSLRQPIRGTGTSVRVVGRFEADPRLPLAAAVVRAVQRQAQSGGKQPPLASPFGNSFAGIMPLDPAAPEYAHADVQTDGSFTLELDALPRDADVALRLDHDHYLLPTTISVPTAGRTNVDLGTLHPLLGALVLGRLHGFTAPGEVDVKLVAEMDMMAPARDPWLFAAQMAGSMRAPARADADGRFALRAVPATASAYVYATVDADAMSADARLGTTEPFGLAPGETREVAVHARPTASVAVTVRDDAGQALADAAVRLATTTGAFTGRALTARRGTTDATGVAHVHGAMTGGNRVEIDAFGFTPLRATVTLAAGEQSLQFQLTRGATIEGRIEDDAGQPVAGARIASTPSIEIPVLGDVNGMTRPETLAPAAENSRCRSDADGGFVLPGLEAGESFTLVVVRDGFAPKTESGVRAGARDVRVALQRQAKVLGRAIDAAAGTPLRAFEVEAVATMMMGMEQVLHRERLQDAADGRFALALSPGRAALRLDAPGFGCTTVPLQLDAGAQVDLGDVAMHPSAFVAGRVVDEQGAPVMGARVQVKRGGMMDNVMFTVMSGVVTDHATSDAEGRFRLDDVTPGRLRLRATHPDFATGESSRVEVAPGAACEDVVLVLDHGGSIAGRLLLAPGTRLADWDVYVGDLRGSGAPLTAELGQDGSFRVENLAQGTYKVQAMNTRSFTAAMQSTMGGENDRPNVSGLLANIMNKLVQAQCQVRSGETSTIELDATDLETGGCTLVVEVWIGDEHLAHGFLEARGAGDGGGRIATIEDGTAELSGLRAGAMTLQVRTGLGFAAVGEPQTITLEPSEATARRTLRLPGGAMAGRVLDENSGEPIRGACVRARRSDTVATTAVEIGFTLTDADGAFHFRGLAPGTYSVVADEMLGASPDRTGGRIEGVPLGAGETRTGLVLRARRGAQVSVTVRDAFGAPVRHAMVLLVDADGQPAATLPIAFTDGDGRAEQAGLPDGAVRAVVRAVGLAPGISELQAATAERELLLDVTLPTGTDVALRLEDADGALLTGATVAARLGTGPWLSGPLLGASGGGDGELSLGVLPAGSVRLRITHPRTGTFEVERAVPAGRRATLTVTAPRR